MLIFRALVIYILISSPVLAFQNQGLPLEVYNQNDSEWFESKEAQMVANRAYVHRRKSQEPHKLSFDEDLFWARLWKGTKREAFLELVNEDLKEALDEKIAVACPVLSIPYLVQLKATNEFDFIKTGYQVTAKALLDKVVASLIDSQYKYEGQYTGWAERCRENEMDWVSTKETAVLITVLERLEATDDLLIERIAAAKKWLADENQPGYIWDREKQKLSKDASKKHLWARFYNPKKNKPISYKNKAEQSYGTWACGIFDCSEQPNVLFIVIDDLNDMIKLLNPDVLTQTPHLDHFAQGATLFTEAYTSASQCNPSRFSVLTGVNPSENGVYCNNSKTLDKSDDYKFLIDYFQDYGYETIGINKIFHGTRNVARVWDEYYDFRGPDSGTTYSPVIKWSADDGFDHNGDSKAAAKAQELLSQKFTKPTFLAIGFYSPHPPWNFARKYFDLYPLDKIKTPQQPFYDLYDVPQAGTALAHQGLMGPWEDYHEKVLKAGEWRNALQAYMAGTTRLDAEFGKVIKALYEGPNASNTIIVVWSDHGFHLGEKQHWKKHALWEKTTHVPFLIATANQKEAQVCDQVVSLLDIYPSLIDLAGLPVHKGLQGRSLKPLLDEPKSDWDGFALTTMRQGNNSIRKGRWRYTRYDDNSEELYDHKFDPNEFYNLAHLEQLNSIKNDLAKLMPEFDKSEIDTACQDPGEDDD